MKGKKDKKDEIVDISTLPKINVVTNSIILNFKNQERRSKLLETMYKATNPIIKIIFRENIIDFAKEKAIFVETPTKKEPTEDDLAKAVVGLVLEKSIPVMKEKKLAMEKNEEQKKLKEELINLINNPPVVDPKKPVNPKDKKKEIQNPDDIKITSEEEFANNADLMLLFYNYPLTTTEYRAMENEKQVLNEVLLISESEAGLVDEIQSPEKGKAPEKNAKPTSEQLLFQKLFAAPSDSLELYKTLCRFKQNYDKNTLMKHTLFEKTEFVFKQSEDKKSSSMDTYLDELAKLLKPVNKNYLLYNKWCSNTFFQKLVNDTNISEVITESAFFEIFERVELLYKDFEHLSLGSILYSLCLDMANNYRLSSTDNTTNRGQTPVSKENLLDNIFLEIEKKILNVEERLHSAEKDDDLNSSYDSKERESTTKIKRLDKNDKLPSQKSPTKVLLKEEKNQIQEENEKEMEEEGIRHLIIDEKDNILKTCMDNVLENYMVFQREKELNLYRNYPGVNRYQMPVIPSKEDNFRKLKKSEIYPFLNVGIPLYEKYEVIKKFEEIFIERIPEQKIFDFSDRKYTEVMNRDLLSQVLANAMLYDCEYQHYYNERDDNLFFATFYRCPRGRVYRKTNSYRYLSKPDFDNWIKYFSEADSFHNISNDNPSELKPRSAHFKRAPGSGKDALVSNINIETGEHNDMEKDIANLISEDILYRGNDTKIGIVNERIKYMFPSDNGIFINKFLNYGVFNSFTSYVIKDNLLFGIRNNESDSVSEFWLKFDNDVYLTMNYSGDYNESKENNDCVNGMTTSINIGNGLFIQILPNGDICQKNFKMNNDNNIKQLDEEVEIRRIISSKASVVKYFNTGNIQIMYANGNVCNISNGVSINTNNKGYRVAKDLHHNIEYEMEHVPITIQSDPEYNTKTLIRDDKVVSVKYPDSSTLTIHNDETKIFMYPDKEKYIIENNCSQDNWIKRAYDSRLATITLPDKTKIFTFKEKKVLKDNSVVFNNVTIIIRLNGTILKVYQNGEAILIPANEREKLNTLVIDEEIIVNENKFLEQLNGTANSRRGGIYTIDLKKKMIWTKDDEGNYFEQHDDGNTKHDVIYVEEEKSELLEKSEIVDVPNNNSNNKPGDNLNKKSSVKFDSKKDSKQIDKNDKDKKPAIEVKTSMSSDRDKTKNEGNSNSNPNPNANKSAEERPVTGKEKLSRNESMRILSEVDGPNSFQFEGQYFINEEMNVPKTFVPPRLFVIANNNTGYELLTEKQVNPFKKVKERYIHTKYSNQETESYFLSHYWLTKYYSNSELLAEINSINDVKIPKKLEKISDNPKSLSFPEREIYYYRNLIESQAFTPEFRSSVEESKKAMENWFAVNKKSDFGVFIDPNTKQELEDMMKVLKRILIERQTPDLVFDYEELQSILVSQIGPLDNNNLNTILFDLETYILEKERKKIVEETDFRKLPLGKSPILIDDIKQRILEEQKRQRKRGGMLSVSEEKIVQEITFVDNFFLTSKGKDISQLYPQVSIAKKKHKHKKKKQNEDEDDMDMGEHHDNVNDMNNNMNEENKYGESGRHLSQEEMDEKHMKMMSPIVYLNENQGTRSDFAKGSQIKIPKITPSYFKQEIELKAQKQESDFRTSNIYHKSKGVDHKVDGTQRTVMPNVPYLKTTFPQAEFNEDYIYVEKMTDHRIKTSSVAKRLYFNAPSINEVRKKGQHNFLLDALEKKNTYDEMMERLNLMITSELCDPLNKMLKIDPISLNFGYIKEGTKVQQLFSIRNDDNITNRVLVRCNNVCISLELFIGGKVRPGETKFIKVVIESDIKKAKFHKPGNEKVVVDAEFEYRLNEEILVSGIMLREDEYIKLDNKSIKETGHSISNQKNRSYIREFPKEELEVEKDSPRTLKENNKNKKSGNEGEVKKKKKKKEVTRFPPLYEKYKDDLAMNEKSQTMKNSINDYESAQSLPKI